MCVWALARKNNYRSNNRRPHRVTFSWKCIPPLQWEMALKQNPPKKKTYVGKHIISYGLEQHKVIVESLIPTIGTWWRNIAMLFCLASKPPIQNCMFATLCHCGPASVPHQGDDINQAECGRQRDTNQSEWKCPFFTVEIGGVVLFGAQRFPVNERIHAGEIGHCAHKQFAI